MIFHCTKALTVKLPEVSKALLADNNPIGSWHAHLHVIDRRQCVMFCHDSTRFILFQAGLKKEQFNNLGHRHKDLFKFALISMGVSDSSIKRVELAMGSALFDTSTDRSVLGTLNQSRSNFDHFINDYRKRAKQSVILDNSPNDFLIDQTRTKVLNDGVTNLNLREVKQMIYDLPELFRTPFNLYFEGYKYNEIADELNEPLGTIKSRIHFARKILKQKIQRY